MSSTVDSRVVEMRFDNSQFEANARQTMSTLNSLQTALNNVDGTSAFESIDTAASRVDLSGIQAGVDALADRFSNLGIVGMTVIQNLANALTGTLGRAISSVTNDIVRGGYERASSLEKARFQLQGLLDTEAEVNEVMQNASDSVKDTAYSLDSAARAASQFVASGVEGGEQMETALRAISGVAATTSSDYDDIARIFTQVSGNGRLMGDQLLQLSVRGLDAAAILAKYFNDVRNDSSIASDHVNEFVNSLSDVEGATKNIEEAYKAAKKAADDAYNAQKKAYDKEYKALQKTLNNEYNTKKKAYDNEYSALQKALNAEISEVQKANAQRLEEINDAYEADVEAHRKATEEKIALINEEYTENLKLIDEERYNRIKAIDDQIQSIRDRAKEEEKARELAEEEEQRSQLQRMVNEAKFEATRKKAEKALADFEEKVAIKRLKEQREEKIESLQAEKDKVNDEIDEKRRALVDKKQADAEIVQDESNAKLKEMQKAHQEEIEAIREEQNAEVERMREAASERLEALRESQNAELTALKEAQTEQLEAKREAQSEALSDLKESQQAELDVLNDAVKEAKKSASKFSDIAEFTEKDIRDMVSDGLIDFDTFAEAMAYVFGDHAFEANRTFEGALSNIRAALRRTGEMFYAPFLAQDSELVRFLNSIRIKINEINKALAPLAEAFGNYFLKVFGHLADVITDVSIATVEVVDNVAGFERSVTQLSPIGQIIQNVGYSIGNMFKVIISYVKPVIQAFKEIFAIDTQKLADATFEFSIFSNTLRASSEQAENIKNTFKGVFSIFKLVGVVIGDVLKILSPLGRLFGVAADGAFSLTGGIGQTITAFVDWLTTSEEVANAIDFLTSVVSNFVDEICNIKSVIGDTFTKAFNGFDIGNYFTKGFLNGITNLIPEVINRIIKFAKDCIAALTGKEGLDENSPSVPATEAGEFFIMGIVDGIVKLAKWALESILFVFQTIVTEVMEFFNSISFKEIFDNAVKSMTDFVNDISDRINQGIPKIVESIQNVFTSIKEKAEKDNVGEEAGENFIISFLKGVKNLLVSISEAIGAILKAVFLGIAESLKTKSIGELFNIGVDAVWSFATGVIKTVADVLGPIGDAFESIFSGMDLPTFVALAAGIGIIWMIVKIAKSLAVITNPLYSFARAMNGLTGALRGFTMQLKAEAILKLVEAVALLVTTLTALYFVLGENVDYKKLITVSVIILAVVGVMGVIFASILKLQGVSRMATNALTEIGVGLKSVLQAQALGWLFEALGNLMKSMIIVLAGVVILYERYGDSMAKVEPLLRDVGLIVAGFLLLFGVLATMTSKSEGFKASAVAFIAFAGMLYLIILSIEHIIAMNINFKTQAGNLLLVAGVFMAAMYVASALVLLGTLLNKKKTHMSAGPFLGFAALVLVTILAIKLMQDMGLGIIKNASQLLMIAVIFGMLVVVMGALQLVTEHAGKSNLMKMGTTLFGIVAFLLGSILAIALLSHMPLARYAKGLLLMLPICGALYAVCKAAALVTHGDGWKSILAMTAVIGAITVAIAALSFLNKEEALKAAGILSAVLLAFGGAIWMASNMEDSFNVVSIIAMITAIAVIGYTIIQLQNIPWDTMLSTAGSIAAVLLAMSGALAIAGNSNTTFTKSIGQFIVGVAAVLAIGWILNWTSKDIQWDSCIALAGSISALLLAIAGAIEIMPERAVDVKAAFANWLTGILAMAAIAGIITAISQCVGDPLALISLATGTGELMLAIAGAMRIMTDNTVSDVGMVIGEWFIGVVAMAVIGMILAAIEDHIGDPLALVALATGIGEVLFATAVSLGVMSRTKLNSDLITQIGLLGSGIAAAAAVGAMLKEFAGTSFDLKSTIALATGISILLIGVAIMMYIASKVGTAAKEAAIGAGLILVFLVAMNAVIATLGAFADESVFAAMERGVKIMGYIGEGIGNFIGSLYGAIGEGVIKKVADSLVYMGYQLSNFWEAATPFFDGVRSLKDDEVIGATKTLAEVIYLMANAEFTHAMAGLISWLTGGKVSMEEFGQKLGEFAGGVKTFAEETANVNGEDLQKVATASKILVEMASKMPRSGGIIDKVFGVQDMEDFGNKLRAFSGALVVVDANCRTIQDTKKLKDVAEAMKSMTTMAAGIPNSGGWLGQIFGSNDVDDFGEKLKSFSGYLVDIAGNFNNVSQSQLDKFPAIGAAMSHMATAAKDLPNSGGWIGKLIGNNDIDDFGYRLKSFSASLSVVSTNIKDPDHMISALSSLSNAIPYVKKIQDDLHVEFFTYKGGKVDDFLNDLLHLTTTLVKITLSAASIKSEALMVMSSSVSKMGDIKAGFESILGNYKPKKINDFMTDLQEYATALQKIAIAMVMVSPATIAELVTTTKSMVDIKGMFERISSGGFRVNSINPFLDDLKSFVAVIKLTSTMDSSVFFNFTSLETAAKTCETIAKTFTTMLSGYRSRYLNDFLGDLKLFALKVSELTKGEYTVNNYILTGLVNAASPLVILKGQFETLSNYRSYSIQGFITDFNSYAKTIGGIKDINTVISNLDKVTTATKNFIDIIPKLTTFNADNFIKFLKDLKEQGKKGVDGFLGAFVNSQISVTMAIGKMFSYITPEIISKRKQMNDAGELIVAYFIEGMHSFDCNGRLKTAGESLLDRLKDAVEDLKWKMEDAGSNAVIGFANGIYEDGWRIWDAGYWLGMEAYYAACRALDEHSPSKRMDKVGSYAGEGFVDGLLDWVGRSSKAGQEIGETALNSVKEAISNITTEIQNEDDFNPTITPVLDLTDIENNAKRISSILDFNKPMQLATSAGFSFAGGLSNMLSNIQASIPDNSNDDVVAAINDLRSDVDTMNSRLTNLQVVMDSGELVGVLTDPIDQQLGFNSVLAERGVR